MQPTLEFAPMPRLFSRIAPLAAIFLSVTLSQVLAQTTPEPPDAMDRALAAAGLTKATTKFDFSAMGNHGAGEFLLPFFDSVHRAPLRIPFYSNVLRQDALKAAPAAGELAMTVSWRMGEGTRRTLISDPLKKDLEAAALPGALPAAIKALHAAAGKPLKAAQEKALNEAVKVVPADIAQNAALILVTEARALVWRQRAFNRFTGDLQKMFTRLTAHNVEDREEWDDSVDTLMHTIDMKYLLVGGIDLAIAADRATEAFKKRTTTEQFSFEWETPQGHIVLRGAGDQQYVGDRPYLLIIDTAGNETYYGGGATYDATHPASVLIDLAGDDRYLERPELAETPVAEYAKRKDGSPRPSFGGGVLGYGVLIDVAGNDFYRSLENSQGSGLFGLGILHDRAGDDRYDAYTSSQGAAKFGIGILGDLDGADQYRCFTTSQGFGATKGYGLLVDTGNGDDLYDANDTVIDFKAPQDEKRNASLAQGMGYGRRADYSDGHSLAGGIGALVDAGGKNSFSCGIFGQGAGYWYGFGLLSTGSGDDTYKGVWYTQGASAHFAVGMIWDLGGNDNYTATVHASQALGHDYGTGYLLDESGNDTYIGPGLSVGAGNNNGFGFFWDKAGDDSYAGIKGKNNAFGTASLDPALRNTVREGSVTLGVFLDTGGNDTYPAKTTREVNNTQWMMPRTDKTFPVQRGVGLDTEAAG